MGFLNRQASRKNNNTLTPHVMDDSSLVVMLIRATNVPKMDGPFSKCDPYVKMWLETFDGTNKPQDGLEGDHAHEISWPHKLQTQKPVWNTARDFGKAKGSDYLAIELWDWDSLTPDDKIGSARIPVRDIFDVALDENNSGRTLTVKIRSNTFRRKTVSLELKPVYDREGIPNEKTLFLVRHGESKWNKAQSEKNLVAMWSHTDHPLNENGVSQAEGLRDKLVAALDDESTRDALEPLEKDFLQTEMIVSSPLCRAVQTGVIGLYPLVKQIGYISLVANAREKRNIGGKDSSGNAKGSMIRKRMLRKMQDFVTNDDLQKYVDLDIDSFEVEHKWWLGKKEEKEEVEARLFELLTQIRYWQQEKITLVGHSHFFRELLKMFMDPSLEAEDKEQWEKLTRKVVENCGVVAVKLQFNPSGNDISHCIKSVKLIFGSKIKE